VLPQCEGAGKNHGAFATIKHSDAARIAADLERQSWMRAASNCVICPDALNPRAELELAARIVRGTI
jgi:hypothetical protein